MNKLPVKGVLFDLWNTLIYNIPKSTSLGSVANQLALETDLLWKAWRRYTQPSLKGQIKTGEERARRVMEELGLPSEKAALIAQFERDNRTADVHFFPGVPEMLAELRERGYKTALVSNTSYLAQPVVEYLELRKKLDAVILSCEVGMVKPEPEIYELSASKLGLKTSEVVFVGDGGDNELFGAIDAGCRVAVVQQERGYAYRNPDNLPNDTDIQLPTVIDILSYL